MTSIGGYCYTAASFARYCSEKTEITPAMSSSILSTKCQKNKYTHFFLLQFFSNNSINMVFVKISIRNSIPIILSNVKEMQVFTELRWGSKIAFYQDYGNHWNNLTTKTTIGLL